MFFEKLKAGRINPAGYREELDSYYNQKYHTQLFPAKPIQIIPELFRRIISFLDSSSYENKIELSCYLLDFSTEAKRDFVSQVDYVIDHQKKTKTLSIISTAGNNREDLRYSCFIFQPEIQMITKKEQSDYIWSNMLWNGENERKQINLFVNGEKEITKIQFYSYRIENVPLDRKNELFLLGKQCAQERLLHYMSMHGSKIGRNELCPCGSGKKYKYCCGNS